MVHDHLDGRILAALEHALTAGDFEVAEHLLKAFETLAAQDDTGDTNRALDEAYLAIPRLLSAAKRKPCR
jgi:hypothetical protein